MSERDSSSSSSSSPIAMPSTAKLEAIILILSLLINIGKYLPWIVLGFAGINLILAVLYFTWWNSVAWGIFNSILAFGGFLFFSQLVRRPKTHRHEYRYTGKHLHRVRKINEKEKYAQRQDSFKSS
jgi:membrane protein implicated in regulation of membrane protease activity